MDPADFALLAYGGAGPLLATGLARDMAIDEVVVPRMPAGFSAWGMLMADLEHDVAQTILAPLAAPGTLERIERAVVELEKRSDDALARQGVPAASRRMLRRLDLRYLGQEHVLEVEISGHDTPATISDRFHRLHEVRYGHHLDADIEVVTVRIRGIGAVPKPQLPTYSPSPLVARPTAPGV